MTFYMRKSLLTISAVLLALQTLSARQIELGNLPGRDASVRQGSSWGVPFEKGAVRPDAVFELSSGGTGVPVSTWPLAYWPDGSLKWLGLAAVAEPGMNSLTLNVKPAPKKGRRAAVPEPAGLAEQTSDGILVNTGAMTCLFPASGDSFIRDMKFGDGTVVSAASLVAILEKREGRIVEYEDFSGAVSSVTLMQNTPLRAVVKIEGRHRSLTGSREWLPYKLFCVMYKDMATLSLTHSFLFDSDGKEDYIKGIGVRFEVPFRDEAHNRHVRFAGDGRDGAGFWCEPVRLAPGYRPSAGRVFTDNYAAYLRGEPLPSLGELGERERSALLTCPVWGDMRLVQAGPGGFSIDKRTTDKSSWVHVTDGGRSLGGALLGDTGGSVFVGVKDFWQSCPSALYVDKAGEDKGYLTAWLWAPDGEAMDMRHYDTVGHDLKINYEDFKEGWESPYGVGHRSTLEIRLFGNIPSGDELLAVAKAVQKPVQYSCSPEYFSSVNAFGAYWGLPDLSNPVTAGIEKQLDDMLEFYKRQVEERSWYGFWNYGDVMHNYDFTRHDWRYDIGGWAWNNIELAPNVLLWTCFLRTGREDIWTMAEAMEKHASEVDVHHIGRFAPLGSRHNVKHWGDGCKQPRIEYAAMKRYMYYLTGGDALTGERMTEQIGSEKAYEYARRVSTWGAVSGTYLKGSLNDWAYYASNWMLEWERTGSSYYRDRLLNSMRDIVALGSMSGRLVFDYFDPETGRFMVYLKEDPSYKGFVEAPKSDFVPAASLSRRRLEKIVGYRLSKVRGDTFSLLFGSPELLSDMRMTVDMPEFWRLADNSFADVSSAKGGSMTGPRAAAWVADSRKDAEMGALAWKNLLDNGFTATESDGTPVVEHTPGSRVATPYIVKPVEEPGFLGQTAGWQRHTPSTTQWLLNAIEVMYWAKPYRPGQK